MKIGSLNCTLNKLTVHTNVSEILLWMAFTPFGYLFVARNGRGMLDFTPEHFSLTGCFKMKIVTSLSHRLVLGATSLVTLIVLAGCVPVEGQKPKLCDQRVHNYKTERCKMVQTKAQPVKAKSTSQSNY
jgi:hypothetical protein